MLTIRLSRVGKKKHPIYRIVISEKSKDTVGDYLELLGHYDPHTNKVEIKADRIKHWLSEGAQTSGTIHNLLVDQKIIEGEKIKVANIKKKSAKDGSASGGKKEEANEEVKKEKEKPAEEKEKKDEKQKVAKEKPIKEGQIEKKSTGEKPVEEKKSA